MLKHMDRIKSLTIDPYILAFNLLKCIMTYQITILDLSKPENSD